MKKIFYPTILVFLVLFFISACEATPAPTLAPPRPIKTPSPIPTFSLLDLIDTPLPTKQVFAPTCKECPDPRVDNTSPEYTYCSNQRPYQSLDVEAGAIVEPLSTDYGLTCYSSGMVKSENGKKIEVWTCTGEQLKAHRVRVINPPCRALEDLDFESGSCPEGFGYHSAQNCCAPSNEEQKSIIVKLNMGACQ